MKVFSFEPRKEHIFSYSNSGFFIHYSISAVIIDCINMAELILNLLLDKQI
jgi:hypothetical protein